MIVNVYFPVKDLHFSMNVGGDLTLGDFKVMCSGQCGVQPHEMKIFLNGQPLQDDGKTLKGYNTAENDMFVVQQGIPAASLPSQMAAGSSQSAMPKIDFSGIKIPGSSSSKQSRQSQPGRGFSSSAGPDYTNPATLREWFLSNPYDLSLLKERNAQMADAIIKGDMQELDVLCQRIREATAKAERETMQMWNADPMDPDVQKKIAEEIARKNIEENMNMAIEEAPESFGQVVMLWINLKVNGHHVKAFVDSGAQMTIMSANCAQRCNIMRLVDKRWAGVAKGVGTQKIIGRVHLAQIQIEDVFLQCSFSVLEEQPMDVLLGLDMLRRHLCVIDLRENALTIGTTKTKTKFLSESELPSHGRLHDPNAPQASDSGASSSEDADINKALLESAAEAQNREHGDVSSADHSEMDAMMSKPSDTPDSTSGPPDDKVRQLMEMGFPRTDADEELKRVNGDLQMALQSLLTKANRNL